MSPNAVARPLLAVLAVLLAAVAGACASSGGSHLSPHDACGLRDADSVFARTGLVYRDCAVDTRARLTTTNVLPDFHPTGRASQCYSAEVSFVVDTLGMPETRSVTLVRTNNQEFGQAVLAIVPAWRYEPAMRDGHRVRQIVEEKRTAQTATVVVSGAGGPPTRPPAQRPTC